MALGTADTIWLPPAFTETVFTRIGLIGSAPLDPPGSEIVAVADGSAGRGAFAAATLGFGRGSGGGAAATCGFAIVGAVSPASATGATVRLAAATWTYSPISSRILASRLPAERPPKTTATM